MYGVGEHTLYFHCGLLPQHLESEERESEKENARERVRSVTEQKPVAEEYFNSAPG